MNDALGWNDPDILSEAFIQDVVECSYGLIQFQIVERIEVDAFPEKADGFSYTPESYIASWRREISFHEPDAVDYHKIIEDFNIIEKIDKDLIDEVWLFAFPYAGYYESIMAGPGAFWCNAPPLKSTEHCSRRFVIMGFNYERGVGEMLEDLGHRAESILSRVFQDMTVDENLWTRFTRYDLTHPGRADVGTVHFAPNSERDYDWGNTRRVLSYCDDWYAFPDFSGTRREVSCDEWGGGDMRLHHLWWFQHFPHYEGELNGISTNWWEYVIDPNHVP
ncbi:MAG: hypothetical protein GTO18_10790 [Anaerolineales bacterium]|nr:hypothetical protein [Anaerolineales bacterium]